MAEPCNENLHNCKKYALHPSLKAKGRIKGNQLINQSTEAVKLIQNVTTNIEKSPTKSINEEDLWRQIKQMQQVNIAPIIQGKKENRWQSAEQ